MLAVCDMVVMGDVCVGALFLFVFFYPVYLMVKKN